MVRPPPFLRAPARRRGVRGGARGAGPPVRPDCRGGGAGHGRVKGAGGAAGAGEGAGRQPVREPGAPAGADVEAGARQPVLEPGRARHVPQGKLLGGWGARGPVGMRWRGRRRLEDRPARPGRAASKPGGGAQGVAPAGLREWGLRAPLGRRGPARLARRHSRPQRHPPTGRDQEAAGGGLQAGEGARRAGRAGGGDQRWPHGRGAGGRGVGALRQTLASGGGASVPVRRVTRGGGAAVLCALRTAAARPGFGGATGAGAVAAVRAH